MQVLEVFVDGPPERRRSGPAFALLDEPTARLEGGHPLGETVDLVRMQLRVALDDLQQPVRAWFYFFC